MVMFYCSENSGKCQDREGRRTLILRRMQPQFYSSLQGQAGTEGPMVGVGGLRNPCF